MGFFDFLTNDQCLNCGSYNTTPLVSGYDDYDEAIEYIYNTLHYGGTIKRIWQCNQCKEYTFVDHYKESHYTHR